MFFRKRSIKLNEQNFIYLKFQMKNKLFKSFPKLRRHAGQYIRGFSMIVEPNETNQERIKPHRAQKMNNR